MTDAALVLVFLLGLAAVGVLGVGLIAWVVLRLGAFDDR